MATPNYDASEFPLMKELKFQQHFNDPNELSISRLNETTDDLYGTTVHDIAQAYPSGSILELANLVPARGPKKEPIFSCSISLPPPYIWNRPDKAPKDSPDKKIIQRNLLSFYSESFGTEQYKSLVATMTSLDKTKEKYDRYQLSHLIIHGGTLISEFSGILAACSFAVKYDESGCSPSHVVIHLIATSNTLLSNNGKFRIPTRMADNKPATQRGLATLLLSYLDIIFRRTYPDVTVVAAVSPENENAKGFFQANGFVEVDIGHNQYKRLRKYGTPHGQSVEEADLVPYVLQIPVILSNPPRYSTTFCPDPPTLGKNTANSYPHLLQHFETYLCQSRGVDGKTNSLHTKMALLTELGRGYEVVGTEGTENGSLRLKKTIDYKDAGKQAPVDGYIAANKKVFNHLLELSFHNTGSGNRKNCLVVEENETSMAAFFGTVQKVLFPQLLLHHNDVPSLLLLYTSMIKQLARIPKDHPFWNKLNNDDSYQPGCELFRNIVSRGLRGRPPVPIGPDHFREYHEWIDVDMTNGKKRQMTVSDLKFFCHATSTNLVLLEGKTKVHQPRSTHDPRSWTISIEFLLMDMFLTTGGTTNEVVEALESIDRILVVAVLTGDKPHVVEVTDAGKQLISQANMPSSTIMPTSRGWGFSDWCCARLRCREALFNASAGTTCITCSSCGDKVHRDCLTTAEASTVCLYCLNNTETKERTFGSSADGAWCASGPLCRVVTHPAIRSTTGENMTAPCEGCALELHANCCDLWLNGVRVCFQCANKSRPEHELIQPVFDVQEVLGHFSLARAGVTTMTNVHAPSTGATDETSGMDTDDGNQNKENEVQEEPHNNEGGGAGGRGGKRAKEMITKTPIRKTTASSTKAAPMSGKRTPKPKKTCQRGGMQTRRQTCAAGYDCKQPDGEPIFNSGYQCHSCKVFMHVGCGTESDWIVPDNQEDDDPDQSLFCFRCVYKSGDCAAGDQCTRKEDNIRVGIDKCVTCGKRAHKECIFDMQCLKCDVEADAQKLATYPILAHDEIMTEYNGVVQEGQFAEDQTGIGTDGFTLAHRIYKGKQSIIKSLNKRIVALRKKKTTDSNKELLALRAELAVQEGMEGEAAMNALLHQMDSIKSLFYSTESNNDNMDDYNAEDRRFFAVLTEAACKKIGKSYPHTVCLKESWAQKNFQPEVLATVKASRAGIVPPGSTFAPVTLKSKDDDNAIKWLMHRYTWRPYKCRINGGGEQDGHIIVLRKLDNGNERQQLVTVRYKSLHRARSFLGTDCVAWILNNVDGIDKVVEPQLDHVYARYTEQTDRQVCALRCTISVSTAAGKRGGKNLQMTHTWHGLIVRGSNAEENQDQYIEKLDTDWVTDNFEPVYIQQCIAKGSHKTNFLKIPPGAPRSDLPPFMTRSAPALLYVQGHDKRLCMVLSLASALHFLGLTELAKVVKREGSRLENHVFQPQKIVELMQDHARWLTPTRLRPKDSSSVLDEKSKVPYPKMIVLQANDGGTEHAVTICGNLVFDSTCPHALPLNRATLNWCCQGTYVGVVDGYCFSEHSNTKKPKVKKQLHDCTI
jgi:hypothetical protein